MAQKSIPIQYPLTFNLILNIREIPFKVKDDIATFFNNPSSPVDSIESGIPSSPKTTLHEGDVKVKSGVDHLPENHYSPNKSPSVNLALSIPPTTNAENFGISGPITYDINPDSNRYAIFTSTLSNKQNSTKQIDPNKNNMSLNMSINSQKSTDDDNISFANMSTVLVEDNPPQTNTADIHSDNYKSSDDDDDLSISSRESFLNSISSEDDADYNSYSTKTEDLLTKNGVAATPVDLQPVNANENDVSPINHIRLRGTIYFYVNQESPNPQLVSGDINHNFYVKDTNNRCGNNSPIQIKQEIDGKSTTSPFNANVTINGNLCIHGNLYNITDGREIIVGNITHIPPRPDTTFTIRETDKQFVHKYFEYSGKIYVDDWNSKIHWHTYYNPENYKVSSFDTPDDTLGVFNIGNWALYKRKINMYIGEVTVMGSIHISPPPFNIDLKKNVSGGTLTKEPITPNKNSNITTKSSPTSSNQQPIETSKVASPSFSDSRRGSRSSITASSNIKKQPLKSKELFDIEKKYTEWKKKSGDVSRYPYRAYYNNTEKPTSQEGILIGDLIDCILFYRSLENNSDLQNEFIDNIHHFLDAGFLDKIDPLVQTILETQTIQKDATRSNKKIPQELIDFGKSFKHEKNETTNYTLLLQSNPQDSHKSITEKKRLSALNRLRDARKKLLNTVARLFDQNKPKDSSISSDTTNQKKQAENLKHTKENSMHQPPDKNTSNDYHYKIIISGTLHTLVGEGKIHHTFYLGENAQNNGEEKYTHTLTKIERIEKDAFSKDAFSKNKDAKFHISGSWEFAPKQGNQDVPDFPKKVDFGNHYIALPFMYKKPTGQNEQPASIEFERIHIYKHVENTDKLLIHGIIDLFYSAKLTISPLKKSIDFDPLIYYFNSKMEINVENKGHNLVKIKGYVVDNNDNHKLSKEVYTHKKRSIRIQSSYRGGRRTRRFRKNLRT